MISCNQVVSAFLPDIFHTFTPKIHSINNVNEIGKSIDRLPNQSLHICEFAEKIFNVRKCVKSIPDFGVIKISIQNGYNNAKSNGSNK
jgi:hypothetical protein